MKKLLFALSVFCFLPGLVFAQNISGDTSSVTIDNPLNVNPQELTVQDVDVEGLTTSRKEFVVGTSGLEEGTQITIPGQDLGQAIKALYRTGLFSNVEIMETDREGRDVYLKIVVEEQPRLEEFQIEGVKRSQRRDLQDLITLMPGYAVTESSLAQARNTIERFYEDKGNWYTEIDVETSITDEERNRVTVTFDIDPGERLEVKEITFDGNEQFSDKKLRKAMDGLSEDRWWKIFSKKTYTEDDFEEASSSLTDFYGENGFLDFRVTGDSVHTFQYTERRLFLFTNEAEGIKVNIEVDEGPQYHVRDVNWDGNTVYSDEELTQVLGFETGDVFNQKKFDENLEGSQSGADITSLYQNIGYLFFNVEPEMEIVGEDSVDLQMSIYEDEIAHVQEVSFRGNTKTHDDVVRRTLRTVPGERYSREKIIRTIRELGQLGYFQPEAINPDLRPDPENQTVDIEYDLDESQSTDNFEFSGGFGGQGIGLILSSRLNFNNFSIGRAVRGEGWDPIPSGDGQELSLGVQVTGSGYQSYSLGFQEPWLAGNPVSLGVNMSYDLINYTNSDQRNELFSSSVSLGRRLSWPDDYISHQSVFSYQLYDVAGGAAFLADGTSSVLSIEQILERNSTDNQISPTTGSKIRLSGEIAPPLPGFSQYYKLKSSYQNHTSIVGKLVLTNSIEYGYLGYLGQGQRSDFQRFKLGGTQLQQRQSFLDDNIDMRGYPGGNGGSISPRRDGEFVGGRLYTKYSFELRYPAITEEQAQVYPYAFLDAGNAYLNTEQFAPFDLNRAVGLGTRIYLPILGLVDLSYGYRLDGIPGTQADAGEWQFLFNIGAPF